MKKILFALIILVVIVGLSFGLYWRRLSIEEQWLFFNKKIASNYAKELLAAKHTKIPDELIDMHIVTGVSMVTFDSNNQSRFFVVAYSPNGVPGPVQSSKPQNNTWIKLQKDWYALDIKEKP